MEYLFYCNIGSCCIIVCISDGYVVFVLFIEVDKVGSGRVEVVWACLVVGVRYGVVIYL